jgi:hypothetical protein
MGMVNILSAPLLAARVAAGFLAVRVVRFALVALRAPVLPADLRALVAIFSPPLID